AGVLDDESCGRPVHVFLRVGHEHDASVGCGDTVVTEALRRGDAGGVVVRVYNDTDRLIRGQCHRVLETGEQSPFDRWIDEGRPPRQDRTCEGAGERTIEAFELRADRRWSRAEVLHDEGGQPTVEGLGRVRNEYACGPRA